MVPRSGAFDARAETVVRRVVGVLSANGTVSVGGGDGVLYALGEVDGTRVWTFDAGNSLRRPAVVDGTADAGHGSGLYALDVSSGGLE